MLKSRFPRYSLWWEKKTGHPKIPWVSTRKTRDLVRRGGGGKLAQFREGLAVVDLQAMPSFNGRLYRKMIHSQNLIELWYIYIGRYIYIYVCR